MINKKEITEEDVSKIFQKINKHKSLEEHFFRKLASTDNPFPWFKIVKNKGYLKPEKNPSPQAVEGKEGYYHIPYWIVLGYLENVATQNAEAQSEEITKLLVETINSIINYKDETGQRIQNNRTDWMMAKIIFKLPLKKIETRHIEFIREALNSKWDTTLLSSEIVKTVIPYIIDNKASDLILRLLDVILDFKRIASGYFLEYNSVLGDYWLSEALRKHKSAIANICGIEAAKIGLKKIKSIIHLDKSRFNQAVIPSIEYSEQTAFPDKYECQLVFLVRDMLEKSEPERIKPILEELAEEEHPILRRILVHMINCNYNQSQDFLWKWKGNPLDEHRLKHEIYELLKSHSRSFSNEQIEKVLEWIENMEYPVRDEYKDNLELVQKMLALRKREWLSALLETKHANVIELHEKYFEINPAKIEHPGFDVWFEVTTKGLPEPDSLSKELLDKTNEEIARYINQYGEETGERTLPETFTRSFKRTTRENPTKFTVNMAPFLNIPREYQYALLTGILEAWNLNKDFPWNHLLEFIINLIEPYDFWRKEREDVSYMNLIVRVIADLIKNGTKSDKHAFDEKLLPNAKKILLILAGRTESDLSDIGDLITSVLNSSRGRIFSAIIDYSLRCARLSQKKGKKKWIEDIKTYFTKCLDRDFEGSSFEFSVTVGEYLANLYYLDDKWVSENINRIFPKDDKNHWKAAFIGYLFTSSMLSKDLYFLLRANNHYMKALQTDFDDRTSLERLVQHIGVAYLQGFETLDDETSLINRLLAKGDPQYFLALIRFFWMLRDKLTDELRPKVKPLWKTLHKILSESKEDPEFQKIISNLSGWLALVDELDAQTVEWLKLSARYIQEPDTLFFIDYLLLHTEKTPGKVGEIFLEILNSGIYPSYKQENIKELVITLYKKSQEEAADRICNLYFDKGFDFLRTVYEGQRSE